MNKSYFVHICQFLILFLGVSSIAVAQTWPNRQIKFVVPFAAGGANDLMARSAAEGASKQLNQNIIIEGTPNGLTYMITLLWCMQNGTIGFKNEEVGSCKFTYRGNINLLDDVKLIENKKPTDKISAGLIYSVF